MSCFQRGMAMWLIWITMAYLHFSSISTQFITNDQGWQYRLPYDQQPPRNPILSPYYQPDYSGVPMPIYGFNPTPYPMAYSMSIHPIIPAEAFGAPTASFQNLPFQSSWTPINSSPVFANQKEYVGFVTEIKTNRTNNSSAPLKNDNDRSNDVNSLLPDFMQGTSDDVQKKFHEIVTNPSESFQEKQSKLDLLVSNLDSKNQELYDQHRRLKELEERQKRERVHAIVANMSEKAQTVFAKLSAVLMNQEMKDVDRMNKINDFYANVDEDVKKEFKERIRELN